MFLLLLGSSGSAPSHSCDYFLSLLSSEVQANLSAAHTLLSPSFSCTLHTSSYQLEDQLLRKNHHQGELLGKLPPSLSTHHLLTPGNTYYIIATCYSSSKSNKIPLTCISRYANQLRQFFFSRLWEKEGNLMNYLPARKNP